MSSVFGIGRLLVLSGVLLPRSFSLWFFIVFWCFLVFLPSLSPLGYNEAAMKPRWSHSTAMETKKPKSHCESHDKQRSRGAKTQEAKEAKKNRKKIEESYPGKQKALKRETEREKKNTRTIKKDTILFNSRVSKALESILPSSQDCEVSNGRSS